MDWFRSYIGTATDTKFRVVVKKSGARLGDVLAVWQMLLERACGADERGNVEGFDFDGAEALLDLEDGQAKAIYAAMEAKELIRQGRITNWDKRQPKREREDNSTDRVKAFRERKKQASNAACDNETPCNATQHQETPRGEESREEKLESTTPLPPVRPATPDVEPYSLEFLEFWEAYPNQEAQDDAWIAWLELKKARKHPGLAALQEAICTQMDGERWQDPKFIPSPGAWLRKGRWKDKPPPARAAPRDSPPRMSLTPRQQQTEMFKGMAKALKQADGAGNGENHGGRCIEGALPAGTALPRP